MACLEHSDWVYWTFTSVSAALWFLLFRLSVSRCPSKVTKESSRVEFGSQIIALVQEPLVYVPSLYYVSTDGEDWAYWLIMLTFIVSSGYFVFDTYLKVRYGSGLVDYAMIPHHLICIGFYLLWYQNSVQLVWYSAMLMLIEISSTALHTGYFARLYNNKRLYFASGVCKLTLYPIFRLLLVPWLGYQVVLNRRLFEEECWLFLPFTILSSVFIFGISAFHFAVNFIGKMSKTLYLIREPKDTLPQSDGQEDESVGRGRGREREQSGSSSRSSSSGGGSSSE